MLVKRGFLWFAVVDLHLPIFAIGVVDEQYFGVPERIDALIHAWDGVRVPNDHTVEPAVVDVKTGRSVRFGNEK